MIDLSSIKQYIQEPDDFTLSFIKQEVKNIGLISYLDYNIKSLDCTRVCEDGLRPMQTIGLQYPDRMSETIYVISNYIEDEAEKDKWLELLIKRHLDNLEYEKLNPPVWYGGDKAKRKFEKRSKSKTKKVKQENIEFSDIPKKQTAAERKLAAKVAKINSLNFNIKPIKHD